jgi:hypothetical protein
LYVRRDERSADQRTGSVRRCFVKQHRILHDRVVVARRCHHGERITCLIDERLRNRHVGDTGR